GWEVAATVPHDGPLVHELTGAGVEVRRLDPLKLRRAELRLSRAPGLPLRWARQLALLRRLARSRRFDVVYTTTAPTLGGSLLARWWRAGHVYHVHEIFWDAKTLLPVFERTLSKADVVICCSNAVREQFRSPGVL